MTPALISHAVLPGNPTLDDHIRDLLLEVSQQIGTLEAGTIGVIPVQNRIRDLRGSYLALNRAVRAKLQPVSQRSA